MGNLENDEVKQQATPTGPEAQQKKNDKEKGYQIYSDQSNDTTKGILGKKSTYQPQDERDAHSRRCSIPTIHNFKEFQKQLQEDLKRHNEQME